MKKIFQSNRNKTKNFQSLSFLLILIGFIIGNSFGINFYFINWNIVSIFLVPFLLEIGNYLKTKIFTNKNFKLNLNFFDYFKRGFLLGIFMEAFKVGS